MMLGLMGQCDGLDTPGRWPGLTSGSPTLRTSAAPGVENAARYQNQSGVSHARDAVIIVIFSSGVVFPQRTEASQHKHGAGGRRTGRASAGPVLLRRSPSPGTWMGSKDENRPGFSRLVCIRFMVNGKTKHFVFLLFWALGGWFSYLLPKAQAAINWFALSWCFVQIFNLDFSTCYATSQQG